MCPEGLEISEASRGSLGGSLGVGDFQSCKAWLPLRVDSTCNVGRSGNSGPLSSLTTLGDIPYSSEEIDNVWSSMVRCPHHIWPGLGVKGGIPSVKKLISQAFKNVVDGELPTIRLNPRFYIWELILNSELRSYAHWQAVVIMSWVASPSHSLHMVSPRPTLPVDLGKQESVNQIRRMLLLDLGEHSMIQRPSVDFGHIMTFRTDGSTQQHRREAEHCTLKALVEVPGSEPGVGRVS